MNEEREKDSSASRCSLRLAHAITEQQRAIKAWREAEDELAASAGPFLAAHKDDEEKLTKLSFVLPNSKVARRVYERIYQLQDLKANVKGLPSDDSTPATKNHGR